MVKKLILKNKKGETLKTDKGVELADYKLESGDVFIPQHTSLLEKRNSVEIVGDDGTKKNKTIINWKLQVLIKDYNDNEPVYINLTPAQAKSINKKIASGMVITQHLFCAYTYKDAEGQQWVGVGLKKNQAPPKTFNDFDDDAEEVKEE